MRLMLLLCLLTISSLTFAQEGILYSRAKINMEGKDIAELGQVGVDVTHGLYAKGRFYINDFADYELEALQNAGFEYEIEIEDVATYYATQGPAVDHRDQDCDNNAGFEDEYPVPENFALGSMAGFFTYQEMLENLDAMAAEYPNLITQKEPIAGYTSIEGRPIYWLRISDNPNTDEETEPEVFYNALHHAREPNSLSQLIFYMWYLLENYGEDPEVTFLVDHTEMYFVPCINPDGYIYNETTNPNGGGLWRKNRRENSDGSFGVDLNRNYGYEWGYDDTGSSPNPNSQVYRGTAPFSEPETQAIRDFCNAHEFEIALNYHTYGNLLIYPWGFSDTPTSEASVFYSLAEAMTLQNNYFAGTGSETVGYTVNGVSDDWMYGAADIYSMTPEVGHGQEGFWPAMGSIIPNCQEVTWMNLVTANMVHNYGLLEEASPETIWELEGSIQYSLKRYGLRDGSLTVALSAISDNIESVGLPKEYNLEPYDGVFEGIEYTLSEDIMPGEEVVFILSVFNGEFTQEFEIVKTYSNIEPDFFDQAYNDNNWTTTGTWGITSETYFSVPSCFTDSPQADYSDNSYTTITLNEYLSIEEATQIKLNFWAKWEIEPIFDYAQVQIAIDNDFFFPVCGRYTVEGGSFQDLGEPIYEGVQEDWVQEEIDLTEYVEIGNSISLRFVMAADGGEEWDGYYFDDLELLILTDDASSSITLDAADFIVAQNRPNPAINYTQIDLTKGNIDFQQGQLLIYNALGQLHHQQVVGIAEEQTIQLITKDWPAGLYFYQVVLDGQATSAKRMTILR